MPWLLLRAIREADMRREMEPFIGYTASLLTGTLLTGVGFLLAADCRRPRSRTAGCWRPARSRPSCWVPS